MEIEEKMSGDFAHGSQAIYRNPVTHYVVIKKRLINPNSEIETLREKFTGVANGISALKRARERANILARAGNFKQLENSNKIILTL
jgi:hypothetical protein